MLLSMALAMQLAICANWRHTNIVLSESRLACTITSDIASKEVKQIRTKASLLKLVDNDLLQLHSTVTWLRDVTIKPLVK